MQTRLDVDGIGCTPSKVVLVGNFPETGLDRGLGVVRGRRSTRRRCRDNAQTAIQAGLWEVTDKTTLEGVQPMPSTSSASASRAVKQRWSACSIQSRGLRQARLHLRARPKQADIFKATTVCPATDQTLGNHREAEVSLQARQLPGPGPAHGQGQGGHDESRAAAF